MVSIKDSKQLLLVSHLFAAHELVDHEGQDSLLQLQVRAEEPEIVHNLNLLRHFYLVLLHAFEDPRVGNGFSS